MAISGLNIALVAGTVYLLFIFWGLSQKKSAALGLAVSAGQVLIAGMGTPVLRAGAMAAVMFLSLLAERPKSAFNAFFFAYWILLVLCPGALGQIAFQLSFLSVFSLLVMSATLPRMGWGIEGVSSGLAVAFGTFPVLAHYFQSFSIAGLFVNLIAIPLFHLALVAGFGALLLSCFGNAACLISGLADFFLNSGLEWIHLWAGARWSSIVIARPALPLIGLYYLLPLAAVWFWKRRNLRKFAWRTGALWLLVIAAFFRPLESANAFELTLLSAGRNELAHLKIGHLNWLINTGRIFPSNQAERVAGSYLRVRGIRRLTGIVLTDFYKRHTAGLETLLRDFAVDYLVFPESRKSPVPRGGASRSRAVRTGQKIIMGKTAIEVLDGDGGKLFLQVRRGGGRFFFLPVLDSAMVKKLGRMKGFKSSDIWILPAAHALAAADRAAFTEMIRGSTAVSFSPDLDFRKQAEAKKVRWLDLEKLGALRFFERRKAVQAFSFLKGEIRI